jgi:predicted Zn-dependent peptidase
MIKNKCRLLIFLSLIAATAPAAAAQSGRIADVSAQAALVSEFDVNGLKVIVKRRANSPTVAGGLYVRGGARNINEKNAGIESLTLATAIEAGKNMPRQTVRRELARIGSAIGSSVSNDYSVISFGTTVSGISTPRW